MKFVLFCLLCIVVFAKKQKMPKVVIIRANSAEEAAQFAYNQMPENQVDEQLGPTRNKYSFKQQSPYQKCKNECRKIHEANQKKDYVNYLKSQLSEAEQLLKDQQNLATESRRNIQKQGVEADVPTSEASRYDHLRAAAEKFYESGAELKNVVTGGPAQL